jgi:hypothetical protein
MIVSLLAFGVLGAVHAAPIATLYGGVGTVTGVMQDDIAVTNAPITVHVMVNGVVNTYTNTYIVSDPLSNSLGSGSTVLLVLQGSTPLIATFSQSTIIADQIESLHFAGSQRTIPISSQGQLQANFMLCPKNGQDGVQFTWPPFSLNSLQFPNGASGKWTAYPSVFNLTLPTPGVNTQQTVTFPSTTAKPLSFTFHATAAAGDLLMQGQGYLNPLTVSGVVTGNPTVMTKATLDIGAGTS